MSDAIRDEVFHSRAESAASPPAQELTMGEDERLPVGAYLQTEWGGGADADGDEEDAGWQSSNREVAEVIVQPGVSILRGKIIAKKPGRTRLTFSYRKVYGFIDLLVVPGPAAAVRFLFGQSENKLAPPAQDERDVQHQSEG